jgi:photosystem II stability/assembly factor-like uncharacterized protein
MKYKSAIVPFLVVMLTSGAACSKFDRSKIRMPKFTFMTSENLHSIAAVGQSIWISGNYGTICFSPDAGKTWQKQSTGVDAELLGAISFVSPQQGWAAGVGGTAIHTGDGGATWSRQQTGTDKDLLDIFFMNAQRGWAVGEYGTLIHTRDGGRSWTQQIENRDTMYNRVIFTDNATGFVVGEFGAILRTVDGGASWQKIQCPDLGVQSDDDDWAKPLPALYGIFFADKQRGWIAGMDGVILATQDAGATWRKIPSGTDKPLYSILVRGTSGFAVGNKGIYLESSDAGATWKPAEDAIKTRFWLRSVGFADDRQGIVVGARGTIARTEDGGKTWDIISGFRYDIEEFGLADF